MTLESERLIFREMTWEDRAYICRMLQDDEVMYAYAHAFCDAEADEWIKRQIKRYQKYGFGLWAVVEKKSGELIGQCGITMQEWGEAEAPEIGYLFCREYWHRGFAMEAALACREYGFHVLGFTELYSIIRENNMPSIRVAERNGMTEKGRVTKHYYNIDMPHIVFSVKKKE